MQTLVTKAKEKIGAVNSYFEGACAGALAAMMCGMQVFCDDDIGFGNITTISVTTSGLKASDIVNRLISIIAAIFVIVGLFKVGTSIFSILEAYSEDNTAAMNKSLKQLGIGAAFIGAPLLIQWLLRAS